MKWTPEKRKHIFDRTSGKCHLCHGPLTFSAYGKKGGWEVEHSIAKAIGGTDSLNNLYPAHIKCNRSKGINSTSKVRKQHNKSKAPLSVISRKKAKLESGLLNGFGMAIVSTAFRVHPTTGLILTAATAIISFLQDPDDLV